MTLSARSRIDSGIVRPIALAVGRLRTIILGDPTFTLTESYVRDAETAARAMGIQIQVLNASTSREINAAFANVVHERPDVLFVSPSPFFISRRVQLTQLAG